jgi:glycosyltransferase involved in cell wall biosynthesis
MKISYGITVCNEARELQHLIEFIHPLLDKEDEIVVVYDDNRVTGEVLDVLEHHQEKVRAFPFDFQQNFLENKNYMNSECEGDYIFQIDADEIPSATLVKSLKSILEHNLVDVLIVPRANVVKGLTQEHINKWGWQINDKGHVNWPDQQKRIYKNVAPIKWSGHKVHGMVEGYNTFAVLPLDEAYCIYHNKEITRQEEQNDRYDKIEQGQLK